MSGQAALASARKRRVNIPAQQSGNGNANNNYNSELNSIAEEFSNKLSQNKEIKVPISSVVIAHENKINILKKQFDEFKEMKVDNLSGENINVDGKVLEKLDTVEKNMNNNINSSDILKTKVESLENELLSTKKELEKFKVIFLNINKIINDLKVVSDTTTNDVDTIKLFLNSNKFVEINEENNQENNEENNPKNNGENNEENKIEIEVKEKE